MMATSQTKHLHEHSFTIVADVQEYRVDFIIYSIVGWAEGATKGIYDKPLWPKVGSDSYEPVDTLEQSEPYLHGEVKSDGCSNWHFDEQDRVMLHGCSRANLQSLGDVLAICWDWAAEVLPNWSAN